MISEVPVLLVQNLTSATIRHDQSCCKENHNVTRYGTTEIILLRNETDKRRKHNPFLIVFVILLILTLITFTCICQKSYWKKQKNSVQLNHYKLQTTNSHNDIINESVVNENDSNEKKIITLILLRHAKSSWDVDRSLNDEDRPLSEDGKNDAIRLGIYLHENNIHYPDLIYSSPSTRTRSTLKFVQEGWFFTNNEGITSVIEEFNSKLYDGAFSRRAYIKFIKDKLIFAQHNGNDNNKRIMIVGHNPAIGELAVYLLPGETIKKFPTGTYCEIQVEIGRRRGKLVRFITPKETLKV